jgi:hypothetical protein
MAIQLEPIQDRDGMGRGLARAGRAAGRPHGGPRRPGRRWDRALHGSTDLVALGLDGLTALVPAIRRPHTRATDAFKSPRPDPRRCEPPHRLPAARTAQRCVGELCPQGLLLLPQRQLSEGEESFSLVGHAASVALLSDPWERLRPWETARGAAPLAAALRRREELAGTRTALIASGGNASRKQLLREQAPSGA